MSRFGRHIHGARVQREALPLADHPEIDLATDLAIVSVSPVDPGEEPSIQVAVHPHGDEHAPRIEVEGRSGVTRVRVDGVSHAVEERFRTGRFWESSFWDKRRWRHHVQILLRVPRDLRGSLRSAATRMNVEHLEDCDLRISADAGSITLDDVHGKLALSTQAGRIDGHGIRGTLDVATSAGAVRLDVLSLDPGTHKIRTTMGAAYIELPKGMPVQVDTRTAMGSSRVDFASVRGAPSILDVEADLGAIRVATSRSIWKPSPRPPAGGGPYRDARGDSPMPPTSIEAPPETDELERLLARVADGSLTPSAARDLLRELGWG